MPEDGRAVAASACLPYLWSCRLLRSVAKSTRYKTFPCDEAPDHRGAPALQEQEHDADHQEDRDEDGLDHLVDRFADEDGGVIDDLVAEAGRKILDQRFHRV